MCTETSCVPVSTPDPAFDPREPNWSQNPDVIKAKELQNEEDAWKKLRDEAEVEGKFGDADYYQHQMDLLDAEIRSIFK